MVFDTLYGRAGPEQGFVAKPQMVAGHTIEDDGRTWKLTLRDGLMFHDGTKVLARDCVASIRRWGARDSFGQTLMQRTDELAAPDDRTIVFRLKQAIPTACPTRSASTPSTCARSCRNDWPNTDPFKPITEVVGSGPFRFKADERVQGSLYVYERFEDYKPREDGEADHIAGPKIVHFDRVEWHINPGSGDGRGGVAGRRDRLETNSQSTIWFQCCERDSKSITLQRTYSTGDPRAAAESSVSALRQPGDPARPDRRYQPDRLYDGGYGR